MGQTYQPNMFVLIQQSAMGKLLLDICRNMVLEPFQPGIDLPEFIPKEYLLLVNMIIQPDQ